MDCVACGRVDLQVFTVVLWFAYGVVNVLVVGWIHYIVFKGVVGFLEIKVVLLACCFVYIEAWRGLEFGRF